MGERLITQTEFIEPEHQPEPRDSFKVFRGIEQLSEPVMHEWMTMRRRFVDSMGWVPDKYDHTLYGADGDRYDDDQETLHVLHFDGDGHPQTGFRLSPVEDSALENALSWQMVARGNDFMVQHDEISGALDSILEENGATLWDLTRLVTNGRQRPLDFLSHAASLMAHAYKGVEAVQGETPSLWLFATTPKMKEFLGNRIGIDMTSLHDGYVTDGDNDKTELCVVDPKAAWRFVEMHKDQFGETFTRVTEQWGRQ